MKTIRLFLLMALASVLTAHASNVYKDNVVILLDTSGSMKNPMPGTNQTKIELAKEALKEVVASLSPETEIGLLIFKSSGDKWVYPLGPRNDDDFFQAVDALQAQGSTPLGEFMKLAADTLMNARKEQYGYGSYRLLVITDGEASDKSLVETYTPQIISRGIITDVIGVDMGQKHTLATKVHSYREANDTQALKQAIREVLAEVGRESASGPADQAFAALDGLPMKVAQSMLTALTVSGDTPIGERSPVKSASPSSIPAPGNGSSSGGFDFSIVFFILLIVVVVVSVLKSAARKS